MSDVITRTPMVTTDELPPDEPIPGDLWRPPSRNRTYVYYDDGNTSQWVIATPPQAPVTGGPRIIVPPVPVGVRSISTSRTRSASADITRTPMVTTDELPPDEPIPGDLWRPPSRKRMYIYYDDGNTSQWVIATPPQVPADGSSVPPPTTPGSGTGDITAVIAGLGLSGGGISGAVTLVLADQPVVTGVYGDETHVARITVNQQGQLTSVSSVSLPPPGSGPAGPAGPAGADSTVPGPPGATGATGPPGTTSWTGITDKPSTFPPDPEAIDDRVAALLVAGANVTLSYNDVANTMTIASTASGGGGGTVTSTSVVSANGLAGTVATPTTTPAITLSTTVTGMLKGNGTAISAGVAGTDYVSPSGLTTALGSYLPLAGGTLTGALAGTSASFSSTLTTVGTISTTGGNLMTDRTGDATLAAIYVRSDAGQYAITYLQSDTRTRWWIGKNNSAETGSNAGSNFTIAAHADDGTTGLGNALVITRSNLAAVFAGSITAASGSFGGNVVTNAGYVMVDRTADAASAAVHIRSDNAQSSAVYCGTTTNNRWSMGKDAAAESTGNAGSNFVLYAYDDAGGGLGGVFTVVRATRILTFQLTPTAPTMATADNSTSLATTAFVKAQGYLTSATAGTTYLPLAGGTLTGGLTGTTATFSGALVSAAHNPDADGTRDLGSVTVRWGYQYMSGGPIITAAAGTARLTRFQTWAAGATSGRWSIGANATAESGANSGSDFSIFAFDDASVGIGTAMLITRATMLTTLGGALVCTGGSIYVDRSGAASYGQVAVRVDDGQIGSLDFQTGVSQRWQLRKDNTAEAGSNAGSDLSLFSYTDAGVAIGTVFTVTRASRLFAFTLTPTAPTMATADNSTSLATTAFVKAQGYLTSAAAGTTYLPLAGGTLTGGLTGTTGTFDNLTASVGVSTILLTSTTHQVLNVSTGSRYYFRFNNVTAVEMQATVFYPTTTNAVQLGGTSNRWSNVLSTIGNFSSYVAIGAATTTTRPLNIFTTAQFSNGDVANTDHIHLEQSAGTPGLGAYGPGISFSKIASSRRGGAIASVQTTADPDEMGLAFFTHGALTNEILVEGMRLGTTGLSVTGDIVSSANVYAGSGNAFRWTSRSMLMSSADGVIKLSNAAQTDFTRLQIGGTTNAFPAIKRNLTALNFRLADDSADAPITAAAATLTGALSGTTAAFTGALTSAAHSPDADGTRDLGSATARWGFHYLLGPIVTGAAGTTRLVRFQTWSAGTTASRWTVGASNTAESGSSAGSDFQIFSYDDAAVGFMVMDSIRATKITTFYGPLVTSASATTGAGFRINHGVAPTTPVNGDMWTTTAGLFVRINGVTKTVTTT